MKTWAWAVPAVFGLALMVLSYRSAGCEPIPRRPGRLGSCVLARAGQPLSQIWKHAFRPGCAICPEVHRTRPCSKALGAAPAEMRAALEARLRPKLIELPVDAMSLLAATLREGRLPEPGKDEVLAGSQAPPEDHMSVAGRTLKVVGVLEPSVGTVRGQLPVPKHANSDVFFPKGDSCGPAGRGDRPGSVASSATGRSWPR